MAQFVKSYFVPLMALLLGLANTASSQTTSFTFDFNGEQPNSLIYQGDAHFPSDTTHLRLTKTDDSGSPQKYSTGRAVYIGPVQFWEPGAQVDFEATLKFHITPVDNNPGDGLVFFMAPVGTTIPEPFHTGGNFGVFADSNGRNPSIFAVEFDTYSNEGDPDYPHVGIDIEYLVSKNTTRVDAIIGQEVTALIHYVEATKMITVKVTAGSKVYDVSYMFDLSTVLNQQVQVGVAASTGGAVAIHDVVSWYFTATLVHMADKEDMKIQQVV